MSVDDIINGITGEMSDNAGVDYIQMTSWLDIVQSVTGLILGIIVFIIIIGVPLVISLELIYINFPLIQDKINEFNDKFKDGKGKKVLGFVFRDAKNAVRNANTMQTGKSVNLVYLGMKIKSIFIATFIVAMVLGAGPIIVQIIVNIAAAILKGFGQLFG